MRVTLSINLLQIKIINCIMKQKYIMKQKKIFIINRDYNTLKDPL